MLSRLQGLRDKAAQFKQAVDAAPAKAAQLREAVNATTGQLHQLRADVQNTVASLKADTEASLAETLVELDGGIGTLTRAGYELTGVDIEQGLSPRVIAHLDQMTVARTTPLETLLQEASGKRILEAILNALIRAEALEEEVRLSDLSFQGLIIHIGAVPTVRMCWRRGLEEPEASSTPVTAPRDVPVPAGDAVGSMFEKSTVPLPPKVVAMPVPLAEGMAETQHPTGLPPSPTPAPARASIQLSARPGTTASPKPALTGDWRKDALARFKKMPDLS